MVVPEPPEVGPRAAPDIGPQQRLFDSRLPFVWVAVAAGMLACDGGQTLEMGSHAPFAGCTVFPTAPPAALGLHPFYVKYLDGHGTPVVSSANVTDEALLAACRITGNMVAKREDVRLAMAGHNHRVAVIAENERTTDIPEYADLYTVFPSTDWNAYRALIWTLAHGLLDLGIVDIDPQFGGEVQTAYTAAMAKGLWPNTSATANADDYWAVGSLAWFGASTRLPVKSRDELAGYDAPLADLLGTYLPASDWRSSCYGD
jgi:hypothetical protein